MAVTLRIQVTRHHRRSLHFIRITTRLIMTSVIFDLYLTFRLRHLSDRDPWTTSTVALPADCLIYRYDDDTDGTIEDARLMRVHCHRLASVICQKSPTCESGPNEHLPEVSTIVGAPTSIGAHANLCMLSTFK